MVLIIIGASAANCPKRKRKVVSRDWYHMSFGIITESVPTGYSQNPSESLRHLRSRGGDLMFKEDSSSHPEAVF